MPKDVTTPPAEENVPRPPNRWILYRRDKMRELERSMDKRIPQAELSRVISKMWANEDELTKARYALLADDERDKHTRDHPHYQYMPKTKEAKQHLQQQRKAQRAKERAAAKQSRARQAPYTTAPHRQLKSPPQPTAPSEAELISRYGPYGPSPPLSGANTPECVPSSPLPQAAEPVASTSQLPPIVPPDAPAAMADVSIRSPAAGPLSAVSAPSSTAALFASGWASSLSPLSTSDESKTDSRDSPITRPFPFDEDMVYTQISADVQGWSDGGVETMLSEAHHDANHMATWMIPTNVSNLFNLTGYDGSVAVDAPSGQIEATFGVMPPADASASYYDLNALMTGFDQESSWPALDPSALSDCSSFFPAMGQPLDFATSPSEPSSAHPDATPFDFSAPPIFPPSLPDGSAAQLDPFQYLKLDDAELATHAPTGLIKTGLTPQPEADQDRFLDAIAALNAVMAMPSAASPPQIPEIPLGPICRPAPPPHSHSAPAVPLAAPHARPATDHAHVIVPQMQADAQRAASVQPPKDAPAPTPTPYVPPAGAGRSSTRRVAASWKAEFVRHGQDAPMDAPPPVLQPVQWGVSTS